MGSCLSSESRSPLSNSPPTTFGLGKKKPSRRKLGSRSSSFDSRKEETRDRLSTSGVTEFASLFTQQGKKGTNQDAMTVWENFGSRSDTIFCGVFDGHGPYGHMVARRVRDHLPQRLSTHWEVAFESADEGEASGAFQKLRESFFKAFKVMDRELKVHRTIDCYCSGTTAVTLVKQGNDLVVGNVGDSRAVLGTRDDDDTLVAVQLTVDLKPSVPAEAERIKRCKGRVFSLQDEPEVLRVWLPENDSPGLAMARSFGDFCLKDYGLIAVPDVTHRRLTESDEFIVLATDGIWDVLSNKEVVNIVASTPSRGLAAKALVESAVRVWSKKYPTSKTDDCAVICLFLDPKGTGGSSSACDPIEDDLMLSDEEDDDEDPRTITTGKSIILNDSDNHRPGSKWSALQGVTRLNTLVTLPKYVPEGGETKPLIRNARRMN